MAVETENITDRIAAKERELNVYLSKGRLPDEPAEKKRERAAYLQEFYEPGFFLEVWNEYATCAKAAAKLKADAELGLTWEKAHLPMTTREQRAWSLVNLIYRAANEVVALRSELPEFRPERTAIKRRMIAASSRRANLRNAMPELERTLSRESAALEDNRGIWPKSEVERCERSLASQRGILDELRAEEAALTAEIDGYQAELDAITEKMLGYPRPRPPKES